MTKIIIHYPFIPHYRVPIFNELAKYSDIHHFEFWAARSDTVTNIASGEDKWEFNFNEVKNISLLRGLLIEYNILRRLISHKPDMYVVLGNPNILSSWFYPLVAKLLKIRTVAWTHGVLKKEVGFKFFVRKVYFKLFDAYWLYGNRAVELLRDYGVSERQCYVVNNSLDYKCQKKHMFNLNNVSSETLKNTYKIPVDGDVLIAIGRLLPKLNLIEAIDYIDKTHRIYGRVYNLLIVGEGPELSKLKLYAKQKNLESRIIFIGPVYDEKTLSELYFLSSAAIVTGIVGLAAMHSLAYGVPVITHNNFDIHCPEVESLVDLETAFFYDFTKPDSAVETLAYLSVKPEIRQSCIQMIESKYTPTKQCEFIIESIDELLGTN